MKDDLEIRIDGQACRGAGECVFRAPGSFAFNERDRGVVRPAPSDDEETILAAARSCPHFAISVRRGAEKLV